MHVPKIHADTHPHVVGDLDFGETAILEDGRVVLRLQFADKAQRLEVATDTANVVVLGTGFVDLIRTTTPCRRISLVTDVGDEW